MKKLIIILILIVFCFGFSSPHHRIIARQNDSGTECSTTTDYIGDKLDSYAGSTASANDRVYLHLYTPTCTSGCTSGTLTTAYMYHSSTGADNLKMLVFLDDGDDVPDSGDSRIDTATLGSSAAEWASAAFDTGASTTCSSKYWIGWVSNSTAWDRKYDTSGSLVLYYQDITDGYDTSMPSDLSGSWTQVADRNTSAYATVGP